MSTYLPSRANRSDSVIQEPAPRSNESKRFRLAPIWPEWNEAEVNAEPWDLGINVKKREATVTSRTRADTRVNNLITHVFEDPEGKIELPPSLKVEQWKRPIDFLSPDKPPVIVDSEIGLQNFDLITPNKHLHHSETMRNIISQIISLWDICRKERKNLNESDLTERTWRPWEHIYAINKVSKQPFITPYNSAGKYIVRLFFLGTWRKIIIDDTIPFDSKNQCLLPQTSLSYELWPMLLSKALLKIISLDFHSSNDSPEYNETSVIHALTGWIPEPIPLKYTHAEKVWNFLRYDRSNKLLSETESNCGPISVFKWPDSKVDLPQEPIVINGNEQVDHQDDNLTKKSDEKNTRKGGTVVNPTGIKSNTIKENRTNNPANPNTIKDTKKIIGASRGVPIEEAGVNVDDQISPEAPKMIVFGTISHLQPTRISSFTETADRSERLRHYNLNDTFSTSILLTSIRDIPLEPPPPVEPIPAWKLIRPRKPKILPHAEPIVPQESKPERWIEITSPYINYPTSSTLNIKPTLRPHSTDNNITPVNTSSHSAKSTPLNITKIDEDNENVKIKPEVNTELVRTVTSMSLPAPKIDLQEKPEESIRSAGCKLKREISIDRAKTSRKSTIVGLKIPSDSLSIKSKGVESEQIDAQTNENKIEQPKPFKMPKIWMNFDDFCACFTSIIVFHNPRGYQYTRKHTEIKFTPYQQPVAAPPVQRDRKKEASQTVVQSLPNLQDDKSSLYLFVDSTREIERNIELIISLTCLSRWYDALPTENNDKTVRGASVSNEKTSIDINQTRFVISQKDIIPQAGSLIAENYSWKSLSMGQPILRLHTTGTKAALVKLPPGRHVLKFLNTCPFAFNLQVLSDTNDFILGDEDQLLNKITSVSENVEFVIRAEELFQALDDSVQNFHLIEQQENKLHQLFHLYCDNAPKSINLTIQTCLNAFNQALYSTLRIIMSSTGSNVNADTQFAWRCFTNDLLTTDILAAYEIKRPSVASAGRQLSRSGGNSSTTTGGSTASKRSSGGREKSSDDKASSKHQPPLIHSSSVSSDLPEGVSPDQLTHDLSLGEIQAVTNIQKSARGFLQRRIDLARTPGTEKNLSIQRILQSTMSLLKNDSNKSALLLFKNFLSSKSHLIQCFSFRNDDWNMVTYQDYHGIYQEQPANTWFILFRDIFYVIEECLIVAKLLCHLSNSVLRVINNDTYDEMPLVFNRLAPGVFTKNKYGYTFIAEGISLDQSVPAGRFRLRLITSYTHLPDIRTDQITSSFLTQELMDYYLPNKQQILCRYRVIVAEDINQTGRNIHLASIYFSTSKTDVLIRLTVLDDNEEIVSVEGKGCVVLPAIRFMRTVSNIVQTPTIARSPLKTGGGSRKTQRGSFGDLTSSNNQIRLDRVGSGKRSRSTSRTGLTIVYEEEEKIHKYTIQVTILRKTWPLTPTQWQFVEQLKEQEKNEFLSTQSIQNIDSNRQPSPIKIDGPRNTSPTNKRPGKGKGNTGKGNTTPLARPGTDKGNMEKPIDITKPHYILRIVSDADKSDELIIKKDADRNEELMNIKKAWETLEIGRAEKAAQTRQKFLDSLQIKTDDNPVSDVTDGPTNILEIPTDEDIEQQVIKQTPITKIEVSKPIDEPLLDEPPPSKPKIILPPLDTKPFIKQKLSSDEKIIFDSVFEQEDFQRRQNEFNEYSKHINAIRQDREEDQNNCYKEKLRQLEQYIELQAKIDQTRRNMNEPREAFRQRFLEIERQRLQELAVQEQKLIDDGKERASSRAGSAKKKTVVKKKKTK